MTDPSAEDLLKSRMINFKVEARRPVHRADADPGEFSLSVTHNGYQWHALRLLPNEARKVIAALENYLTTLED